MIITIDGPAGSGKSTAARKLAARLGIPYLDTGAMYRVITLAALHGNVDLHDQTALERLAGSAHYHLDLGPTHIRVTLDGHDVTEAIRSMHVSEHTRFVASCPAVRRVLVEKQREIGRILGSMVTEGRDQGSIAFPNADAKFYLDADLKQRAQRRLHELLAEGEVLDEQDVLRNVMERDRTDSERSVAPLRKPDDAILIDASHLSAAQVIQRMLEHLFEKGLIPRIPHEDE